MDQSEQLAQSKFSGWAIIEIYGHSKAVGYCTTEYFGSTCMFRVDTPELPERDSILEKPQYVAQTWAPAGSKVRRPMSPARSELLGMGAIFRLHPCSNDVALKAIEQMYERPLILLELPPDKQISAGVEKPIASIDPVCGAEVNLEESLPTYTWDGRTYAFCSRDCKEEFVATPEDYVESSPTRLAGNED